jgi:hypothetical protein
MTNNNMFVKELQARDGWFHLIFFQKIRLKETLCGETKIALLLNRDLFDTAKSQPVSAIDGIFRRPAASDSDKGGRA